jgi:hypothetical protein
VTVGRGVDDAVAGTGVAEGSGPPVTVKGALTPVLLLRGCAVIVWTPAGAVAGTVSWADSRPWLLALP